MNQYQVPLPPEKKKKIVIFGIIPVLLLLLAILLYVQFSPASSAGKPPASKLNMAIPDHSKADTATTSKSDLYTMLEDRQKKDSEGKAVFNANEKLNLNTDVGANQDLKTRLAKEVVKPNLGDNQAFPSQPNFPLHGTRSSPTPSRTTSAVTEDAAFNSIVIALPEEKKTAFSNPATMIKEVDINCPAIIPRKTKIADGGSVSMELQEDLAVGAKILPKGSMVTGVARLEQTRITLHVGSVNIDGKIVFAKLTAYDMDGVEGLHMPGNMALKRGANQTVDDQIDAVGTDAESQLAGLGGQMVGGVIRNIVHSGGRKQEATIPAGYKIILKNN